MNNTLWIGIDPGNDGGIAYSCRGISFAKKNVETPEDFKGFGLWLESETPDIATSLKVIIEKPLTNAWMPSGPPCPICNQTPIFPHAFKSAAALGRTMGMWEVALAGFDVTYLTPATWRKAIFGKGNPYPKKTFGKMRQKEEELKLARTMFPAIGWGRWKETCPKSENRIYGLSAALLIMEAGKRIKEQKEKKRK